MNLEKKGILVVVSGFSGSGKGTIMKELLKKYPEQYALSISATTRQPREGETDGVEYFFKEKGKYLNKMYLNSCLYKEILSIAKFIALILLTSSAFVSVQFKSLS